MKDKLTRRHFLAAAGAAPVVAATQSALGTPESDPANPLKILGISCSPRKGMTTAAAVRAALDAAKGTDPSIQTELLDLGGLEIAPWSPEPPDDDMNALLPKFRDPALGGIIVGSPCYFRSLSGLAKCFLERLAPLRKPEMLLADLPFGVVTVGGFRNGGQELTIGQIQTILLCYGMIPVGGHAPAYQGATLQSAGDSIKEDELGLQTAFQLGKRVAEVAVKSAMKRA